VSVRRAPFVGASVTVAYLARQVAGTVEEVGEGGRRLLVVTEEGQLVAFSLRPASGRFLEEGRAAGGARLLFDQP
jgi:hypothetical protein